MWRVGESAQQVMRWRPSKKTLGQNAALRAKREKGRRQRRLIDTSPMTGRRFGLGAKWPLLQKAAVQSGVSGRRVGANPLSQWARGRCSMLIGQLQHRRSVGKATAQSREGKGSIGLGG